MRSITKRMSALSGVLLGICLAGFSYAQTADEIVSQLGLRESKVSSKQMPGWRKPENVVFWGKQADLAAFEKAFPDITFTATEQVSELGEQLKTADAYIGYCIAGALAQKINVSWVQSLGVGVEGCVYSQAFKGSDITLTNGQRLSAPGIAEHAIGMMFSLVRRLDEYGAVQSAGKWERVSPGTDKVWEISGRTMLVVGLGGIGTETARRANGLGMKVIATRNSSRNGPEFVDYVGLADELHKLAAKADVIVNTVPLTENTTGLFDRAFFKAMQPHAYFINIARGKSVVTDDLLAALNTGELAGAALDVTDPEPLPEGHPLWQQPRVIITPHIAWRSEKVRQRVLTIAQENLRRYLAGEKLLSQVYLDRGY